MQLYVVRHGTTDNNEKKLINGKNNIDINQKGIEDAKTAKKILGDIEIDKIYCSPLLRAKHTMEIINDNRYPVVYDERLMERDAGVLTNKSEDEMDFILWNDINSGPICGGAETFKESLDRVSDFLEEIKEKHLDDKVLLVTHFGIIKAIEVLLYGYPGAEELNKWNYSNGTVRHYQL